MALSAAVRAPLRWYCCSDGNHAVLADRLAASLAGAESHFAFECARVGDLEGLPGRAAGGPPVMDFKLGELARLNACSAAPFVWSDVDVQLLASPASARASLDAALDAHPSADLIVQREFDDAGCNVGFLVARPSPRLGAFLADWRDEARRTKRLDQKVLNARLLRGDCPIAVARFPSAVWASSNVLGAPPALDALVLHHANFVASTDRRPSSDPGPKLAQLDAVRALRGSGDAEGFAALVDTLRRDASLAAYRGRHFPDADVAAWAPLK